MRSLVMTAQPEAQDRAFTEFGAHETFPEPSTTRLGGFDFLDLLRPD